MNTIKFAGVIILVFSVQLVYADKASITIQADKPGAKISPTMWGIFFEDLNFAADGGLYAELVKNRSFEFPNPMMGWKKIIPDNTTCSIEITDKAPFNDVNPHYLRIKSDDTDKISGVSNEGFRDIGMREGESYIFSAQVRVGEDQPTLRIALKGDDGKTLAEAKLNGFTNQWKKYTARLNSSVTEPEAKLNIYIEGSGEIELDMVSLFPEKTWKNRPNGLRDDLVQMIADLKPGFIKFPGGFLTETRSLDNRYQWKQTIGGIAERKLSPTPWSAFAGRSAPDYFQSYGLGFFEYFQLCEELGAEPLPMLNCGMAAQFTGDFAPINQLEPYIQDALDLIEFANGPATSIWGKKRAEMGHPKSFNLKMLRWGNETVGPQYIERYERLAKTLKARHPEIKIIAGSGPEPFGDNFEFAWDKLSKLKAAMIDEHAHKQPNWFFNNDARYDKYDRNGPKVIFGEYAAHSEPGLINPNNRSNLECALSEAAFFTGLERNADIVEMSCYAPLFAHVDAWQWKPNLIWFDNLNVYGTPSYYVQQMFSSNRGDVILPLNIELQIPNIKRLYASAVRDNKTGEIILKTVNPYNEPVETKIKLTGVKVITPAKAIILTSEKLSDENSFESPKKIFPKEELVQNVSSSFNYSFRPFSLTVLRLPIKSSGASDTTKAGQIK